VFVLLLEAEGVEVVATGSGRQALALAVNGDFDVLLTDLDLPDIGGEAVIREIRATVPRCPRVIVLTGASEPYLRRARDAGADIVLRKPIDWAVLWTYLAPTPPEAAA
jgi:CheY-like chemotaxis protein